MPSDPNGSVLLDADAVRRALTRISHEIHEKNGAQMADVILLGIPARGDVLARRLRECLERDHGAHVPLGVLDLTFHRDDVGGKAALPKTTSIPGSVDGKVVVLVDDVLFTGRSVRAALDALVDYGRPKAVQLAVLVDRGHRELPIKADYVGKNVPTELDANVKVEVAEVDGQDRVLLEKRA
jgi:pyrimidine operon attenuation protein/uracil phosphoribosyltransferase